MAIDYLKALGGNSNIDSLTNYATRLRVKVEDISLVADDNIFKEIGAAGVVRSNLNIQVIVGLRVPQVRGEMKIFL